MVAWLLVLIRGNAEMLGSTRTAVIVLATMASMGFSQIAAAQAAATPLDGVWKVTKYVATGADPSTVANPQASLIIFSRGYYSYISVGGDGPRTASPAAKDPTKLSDAEKLARYDEWNRVTANAGTYELKGNTISRHAVVAKNVAAMTPAGQTNQEFTLSGNSLVLISKSAPGQPVRETRTTLTRIR